MQPRQRGVHGVIDLRALGRIGGRHLRLPDHPAFDVRHDEEGGADHALVGAIEDRLGDRKALRVQRGDHAVLAIHSVRGGKQLARRFASQHVTTLRRFQEVSGVRLPALELADGERPGEALCMLAQIRLEPPDIEAQALGDLLGAGKCALAVGGVHPRYSVC